MADVTPQRVNVKDQIKQVVKDAISKTPHDITTHKGLTDFKNELMPQILGGFPQEKRSELSKLVESAIASHGEFHDINREKSEGEMKRKKQ
ncbi:Uncharacterised protein [uncultured archaeon]|nr:Uncharacterised protein [uncultured archaeon]